MNNNVAAIRATCFSDRSCTEKRNRHHTAAAERNSIAPSPPKARSAVCAPSTEQTVIWMLPLLSKPVPETVYGSEVGWTAWIVLQLLSKCHDVIVNSTAAGAFVFIAANFLQQLCLSDEAVGILNKKL
jgi:hypothetical protein